MQELKNKMPGPGGKVEGTTVLKKACKHWQIKSLLYSCLFVVII
jgi:hypothetical protein